MSAPAADPFACRAVAERLERAGRWTEALSVWCEVLRVNPQSALAVSRVSALRAAASPHPARSRVGAELVGASNLPPPIGQEAPAVRSLRAWALALQKG